MFKEQGVAEQEQAFAEDSLSPFGLEIKKMPVLSRQEERVLIEQIKRGDEEARIELVRRNQGLIKSIAQKYTKRCTAFTFLDLMQEGNMGLLYALKRFDVKRGLKFSTYATPWIKQFITRAIDKQDDFIRLPRNVKELNRKRYHIETIFISEHGRKPTDREVSALLGIPQKRMATIRSLGEMMSGCSLDADLEDEESTPHHLIADESVFHPDASICRSQLQVLVRELLSNVLDPQEKEIIEMRFDLNETGDDVSAAEIGRRLGVKRDTASRLVTGILAKIRDALQKQEKTLAF